MKRRKLSHLRLQKGRNILLAVEAQLTIRYTAIRIKFGIILSDQIKNPRTYRFPPNPLALGILQSRNGTLKTTLVIHLFVIYRLIYIFNHKKTSSRKRMRSLYIQIVIRNS